MSGSRWSEQHRAFMSALHRKRHGAPVGMATVYGIHVPYEHKDPLYYWAVWLAGRYGRAEAERFIQDSKDVDWENVPELRRLWELKLELRYNRETIREIHMKAIRNANQDSR